MADLADLIRSRIEARERNYSQVIRALRHTSNDSDYDRWNGIAQSFREELEWLWPLVNTTPVPQYRSTEWRSTHV